MITFLLIILFIMGLLAVPLDLWVKFSPKYDYQTNLRVGWMFGLLNFLIPFKKDDSPKKSAPRKKKSKGKMPLKIMGSPKVRSALFNFLRKEWRALHFKMQRFELEIGLGDPAATGELIGELFALQFSVIDPNEQKIKLTPNFNEETFKVKGAMSMRLFPLQLIGILLGLIFSISLWRGIYEAEAA